MREWMKDFLEAHGDPGPEDWLTDEIDRTEWLANEPSLTVGERNK